jgi:hypothetical protein
MDEASSMSLSVRSTRTILLIALWFTSCAYAAGSPVGYWLAKSPFFYDRPVAVIKTYLVNKELFGEIVKVLPLNESVNYRKNYASSGPVMIWNFREENGVWVGGRIYEQITARSYSGRISVSDDGRHLYVRGWKGPFYRTATWDRIR